MSTETKTANAVEETAIALPVTDKEAVKKLAKKLAIQLAVTAAIVVTTHVIVNAINKKQSETPEA